MNRPDIVIRDLNDCLTPKQVAERLGRTERTLWKWRKNQRGPKYKRLEGRVFYPIEDFNNWVDAGEWA